MTDAELSELERLAKEATPGPWPQGKEDKEFVLYNGTFICGCNSAIMRNGDVIDGKTNARYIAAANPAAILELIAELRQTRKERDWLAITLAEHCNEQASSVYDAASQHCTMCNCRCLFPYKECSIINDLLWLQAAKEATCQKN